MSIESDGITKNFLTIYYVQELPENELAIVSASVEDRNMETNFKAEVRGFTHILPSL